MNILVTGGNGYIGAETVKELFRRKHNVVVMDDLSAGNKLSVSADCLRRLNICSSDISFVIEYNKIEAVLHLAALASVPNSINNPASYYNVNVVGTLRVLEGMKKAGINKIVFASTGAIESNTPYGHTKLAGEHMIRDMFPDSGIILRYFNVTGGNDHSKEHVLPHLVKAAEDNPFHICGSSYDTRDGTCVRDYVYVKDVAMANCLALEKDSPGCYEVGTGIGTTVLELMYKCRSIFGRDIPLIWDHKRPGDPDELVAGCFTRFPGWEPQYDLEDIIRSVM